MTFRITLLLLAIFFLTYSLEASAQPYYGGTFSYVAMAKEPPSLRGVQFMFNYDPEIFQWRKFNVYFDGGFSHFWQNSTPNNRTLEVVSAAPVVRYTFRRQGPITPYLELSIGVAYLSATKIDNRDLGMHFAFQDRMGIGMVFGNHDQFSAGIHAMHYSNANLCRQNSGITMPLVLDVGYRFQ